MNKKIEEAIKTKRIYYSAEKGEDVYWNHHLSIPNAGFKTVTQAMSQVMPPVMERFILNFLE